MDGAGDLANAGELQGDGMVAGRESAHERFKEKNTQGRFWCKRPCVLTKLIRILYTGCKRKGSLHGDCYRRTVPM